MGTPDGLGVGGAAFWDAIVADHDLDVTQLLQLEEACRAKDRLDKLDRLLRGDVDTWASVVVRDGVNELKIDAALTQANATANLMKQLIAAMRLPDATTGKKPQYRGARGAHKPKVPGGTLSSLERTRAAKSA